jgi:hypothetical protein
VRLPPPPKTSVGAFKTGWVSPAESESGRCTLQVTGFTIVYEFGLKSTDTEGNDESIALIVSF